jgi:hypothetical protein
MEEWKTAVEDYKVSNLGNCKRGEKKIKCSITNKGYKYFQIIKEGKKINYLIHQQVARLFIGERICNLVVDHEDQNKLNNDVSNLRYITQSENMTNTKKYRTDILETDPIKRRNILQQERDKKTGHTKGIIRPKGSGSIRVRTDNNPTYNAIITINKQKYTQTFETLEEAEKYLKDIKKMVEFGS